MSDTNLDLLEKLLSAFEVVNRAVSMPSDVSERNTIGEARDTATAIRSKWLRLTMAKGVDAVPGTAAQDVVNEFIPGEMLDYGGQVWIPASKHEAVVNGIYARRGVPVDVCAKLCMAARAAIAHASEAGLRDDALLNLLRACTVSEAKSFVDAVEAAHRGEQQRTDLIGWPESWPKRYNAGNVPCDMLVGPCACGAWHKAEPSILREVLQLMEPPTEDKERTELTDRIKTLESQLSAAREEAKRRNTTVTKMLSHLLSIYAPSPDGCDGVIGLIAQIETCMRRMRSECNTSKAEVVRLRETSVRDVDRLTTQLAQSDAEIEKYRQRDAEIEEAIAHPERLPELTDEDRAALNSLPKDLAAQMWEQHNVRGTTCAGCHKPLEKQNAWMEDGCPCNSRKGVNDGNLAISQWRAELLNEAKHEIERLTNELLALGETERQEYQSEIATLKAEIKQLRQRLLTAAGDDLCHLTQEEIDAMTNGEVPIPPLDVFLPSCIRFWQQTAYKSGVNENCLTLAQLVAENEKQRAEIERLTRHNERETNAHGRDVEAQAAEIADLRAKLAKAEMERAHVEDSTNAEIEAIGKLEESVVPAGLTAEVEAVDRVLQFALRGKYDVPFPTPNDYKACSEAWPKLRAAYTQSSALPNREEVAKSICDSLAICFGGE